MKTLIAMALMGLFMTFALTLRAELDNESTVTNKVRLAADLPATVVVRMNTTTGHTEMLSAKEALSGNPAAVEEISHRSFTPVLSDHPIRGELDRDGSTSSWYFNLGVNPFYVNFGYSPFFNYSYSPYYYSSAFNPYFNYGGYNYSYSPYYAYNFGPYWYGFYRW